MLVATAWWTASASPRSSPEWAPCPRGGAPSCKSLLISHFSTWRQFCITSPLLTLVSPVHRMKFIYFIFGVLFDFYAILELFVLEAFYPAFPIILDVLPAKGPGDSNVFLTYQVSGPGPLGTPLPEPIPLVAGSAKALGVGGARSRPSKEKHVLPKGCSRGSTLLPGTREPVCRVGLLPG